MLVVWWHARLTRALLQPYIAGVLTDVSGCACALCDNRALVQQN
jgi:hypothetical protein